MSFSPNLFLANMNAKGGPAKPSRFEVILPIPQSVAQFIEQGILEKVLNLGKNTFGKEKGSDDLFFLKKQRFGQAKCCFEL